MVSGLNFFVCYLHKMHKTHTIGGLFCLFHVFGGSTCSLWGKCNIGSCEVSITPAVHKNQFRIYYLYEEC